jgi:hypothetical protein
MAVGYSDDVDLASALETAFAQCDDLDAIDVIKITGDTASRSSRERTEAGGQTPTRRPRAIVLA